MAGTAVAQLEEVYRHWAEGDWSPRFEFYADGFEWGWSDEFPEVAGVYEDTRSPNPRLHAWLSPWDTWRCVAEDYLEHGDTIVVLARYSGRGKGSGVEVDVEGAHVWKVRDGKAVWLEVFASRELALDAAGIGRRGV